MDLETVFLWCLYVGALEGRKRRNYKLITDNRYWVKDLTSVREELAMRGLVL